MDTQLKFDFCQDRPVIDYRALAHSIVQQEWAAVREREAVEGYYVETPKLQVPIAQPPRNSKLEQVAKLIVLGMEPRTAMIQAGYAADTARKYRSIDAVLRHVSLPKYMSTELERLRRIENPTETERTALDFWTKRIRGGLIL